MEATVAVGLVSSAVQFTDFSTRLIRLARVIYKNGSDRIPEKLNAQALIEGAKESVGEMAREYSTPADAATIDLISRCRIVIADIEALFPSNNSASTNKLLKGFRSSSKAIAFLWKKSDFDESMNRLNQLKAELYAKFHKDKLREALIQHETTHQEALVQFEHVMMQQSQNHTVLIITVITISALLIAIWIQQYQGFTVVAQQHDSKLQEEVLDWFSEANLNFSQRHQEFLSVRAPETGSWLLEHDEYKRWNEDGRNETLWLRGIPGSGKTMLAAIAIDHLRETKRAPRFAVAYIFCDYRDDERQTPENLMSEIIRQVIQKRPLSQELLEFYKQHKADRTRPRLSELTAILEQEINRLSTTFLAIDAVDELVDRTREILLREVAKMTKFLNIMITSRPHIHLETRFPNSTVLEIVTNRQDIERYAHYRMASDSDSNLAGIVADAPDLRRQIVETVCNKSRGLFLLSQLHLNLLEDNREKRALRRTLNSLPGTLGAMYENTIDRINSQSKKDRKTAIRALQWLVNSHQPLDIESLQHALAIEHDTNTFDKEGIIEEKSLLLLCKGLIVVDQEQTFTIREWRAFAIVTRKPVRFAHQSVLEYLKSRNDFRSDEIDGRIAHDCLTYVSHRSRMCDLAYAHFHKLLDNSQFIIPLAALSGVASEYPLYGYAVSYWPEHAQGRAETSLSESIGRFIGQNSNFWCASQFDSVASSQDGYKPLPFLAFHNLAYTIRHIPNEILIRHPVDLEQLTSALMAAAKRGNVEAFRSLIENSLLERLGLTASFQQLVVNALITAVLFRDKSMAAASIGAGASVNILTSADIRAPSTLQEYFRQLWVTLLSLACFQEDSDMVEFLLANGAYPNAAYSMLPLEIASLIGHVRIVKLLLNHGVDVTFGSRWLGSPLFCCIAWWETRYCQLAFRKRMLSSQTSYARLSLFLRKNMAL